MNMKKYRALLAKLCIAVLLATSAAGILEAGTTGIISGFVKDADTGEVLSGVNVFIYGTKLATVTDKNGYFVITNVPPGTYEITADIIGYGTKTLTGVQVSMDATTTLEISLAQETLQEEDVVIIAPKPMIDPATVNTLTQITSAQSKLTMLDPISNGAVGEPLSTLPGVIVEPDGSGQVRFRGGRPDQAGWYIEGIPITDPNTGMFSTNLYTTGVSKFQTYTGGFGAEFGNAISGVMNEIKKTGVEAPGLNLDIRTGSQGFRNAIVEFGGGAADTFNYYLATTLNKSNLDGPIVRYQEFADNIAKFVWPWKKDTVSLLVYQGSLFGTLTAFHDMTNNNAPVARELDWSRQRFALTALTWSHNFNADSFLTIRPYYLFNTAVSNWMGGSQGLPFFADVWSRKYGFQANYTWKINKKHLLKVGGSILDADNNYYLYAYLPPPDDMILESYHYQADVDTFQKDFYIQDEFRVNDKWTLQGGIRYDSIKYDRTGRQYVEGEGYSGDPVPDVKESKLLPRLGLSFAPNSNTAWKFSYGKYAKFIPSSYVQVIYFAPDDPIFMPEATAPGLGSTDPQESAIYEISYEKQLSEDLALRLTPFYTKYKNLGDYTVNEAGIMEYKNVGKGESKGLELLLRKKASKNLQGWLSYTYMTSKANRADLGLLDKLYYTSWDQRHIFSLVSNYKLGKCTHNLRFDFGSGRADNSKALSDPSLAGHAAPYFIVNYGINYELPKNSAFGDSIYMTIFNIFNKKQTLQYQYVSDTEKVRYAYIPKRFISFGLIKSY